MKLVKSLLLASVAGLSTVAVAQAADLPSRKAAPVEYVKVCNAYGAGFFYIPGTDTCLKVGGLVSFDARAFGPVQKAGYTGGTTYARPKSTRDTYGTTAVGRVELDARTQTAWGTLRSFVRLDGVYSSASTGTAGSLAIGNGPLSPAASKDVTYVNKAFIQFAGITAGRAQSMFDFYADAYNNELLRGSNATTTLLAYTATFGGGFSATVSFEDGVARRSNLANVIGPAAANAAEYGGNRSPDLVAALRVDQAWGSAQLSAAAHRINGLQLSAPVATATAANIVGNTNSYGYAVQGGLKINLPMLAAGDALYLQATYAKGAVGYLVGTNLVEAEGFNNVRHQGAGPLGSLNGSPLVSNSINDCVFTAASKCDKSSGYAITGAFKHFWTPSISQSLFASYMSVNYGNAFKNSATSLVGTAGVKEWRVGTNVFWTPVKGFDIGGEVMYQSARYAPTAGTIAANPLYPTKVNQTEYRLVVRRAF